MSLPIIGGAGGAKRRPTRSPTHKALDHQKMLKLGLSVEDAADDEPISADVLDELALELGVDASHLYAAASTTTDVVFVREHKVAFIACGGICQNWGALECIETLVDIRQQRMDAGLSLFDIHAKSCLDACEQAPTVLMQTPDGTALIDQATPDKLREAVAHACDDT